MDALAVAVSGVRSAETRLFASAHNVANLATPSFRPLRTLQTSVEGGGSMATLERSPIEGAVSLAHEIAEQIRASTQFNASLRVLAVGSQLRGHLINLVA